MTKQRLFNKICNLELDVARLSSDLSATLKDHKKHIEAIVECLGLQSTYVKSIYEGFRSDEVIKTLVYSKKPEIVFEAVKNIKNKKKK